MKKIIIALISFVILIISFGCSPQYSKVPKNINSYKLDMVISNDLSTVDIMEEVVVSNNYGTKIDELCFNLYPNSYTRTSHNKAYPNTLSKYGGIEILSVKVNSIEANEVVSNNGNFLIVPLETSLEPNEKVIISMILKLTIPSGAYRLGLQKEVLNLGNFYPILSVFENGKFRQDNFTMIGDPFYSDVSNYEVVITCDTRLMLATSGAMTNEYYSGKTKKVTISEKAIRDFALVASFKFKKISTTYKDTRVDYFYFEDSQPETSLMSAVNALRTFSEALIPYPYSHYTVVETPFAYGGMEYPCLVYITSSVKDKTEIIIHETAHQWSNCLVGSDSINNSWVDEGITSFLSSYYYVLNNDTEQYNSLINKEKLSYRRFLAAAKINNPNYIELVDKPIYNFVSDYEYTLLVYSKMALMYDTLYKSMGRNKFDHAMKNYFEEFCYKNASKANLIDSFDKVMNVRGIFDSWLKQEIIVFNIGNNVV